MVRITFIAAVVACLGGCSSPAVRVFPGNYEPVFSPSAAGGECSALPYTHECQTNPNDVVAPAPTVY